MMQLTPEAIRRSVRELPALPAVVLELIQSLGDSEVSAEQLAAKISQDQAIAAKTLRLANSSFYGLPRQVTSIAEATTILGLRTLRSVATAAGLAGGFASSRCEGFDFDAFWRHGALPVLPGGVSSFKIAASFNDFGEPLFAVPTEPRPSPPRMGRAPMTKSAMPRSS